jgi:6-phosphogluconate dehydrogenase
LDIAEVLRRGTVIGSWPLDLTARALAEHPDLQQFSGRVSDSGEVRWTAIDTPTRAPVLTAALCQRFSSRGEDNFHDSFLSAMRYQIGGHLERPSTNSRESSLKILVIDAGGTHITVSPQAGRSPIKIRSGPR